MELTIILWKYNIEYYYISLFFEYNISMYMNITKSHLEMMNNNNNICIKTECITMIYYTYTIIYVINSVINIHIAMY